MSFRLVRITYLKIKMKFLITQVTNYDILIFLANGLSRGEVLILLVALFLFVSLLVVSQSLSQRKLSRLVAEKRKIERALADMEAGEAQIRDELDQLRRMEEIMTARLKAQDAEIRHFRQLKAMKK